MRRHRRRYQVGEIRRSHLLQNFLAPQCLHGRTVVENEIHLEALGPGLRQRALADVLGTRAPKVDLDAVLLRERTDQRRVIVGRRIGIERERTFPLAAFAQALLAIATVVAGDLGDLAGLRPRRCCRHR
jgi:hypothetical protein